MTSFLVHHSLLGVHHSSCVTSKPPQGLVSNKLPLLGSFLLVACCGVLQTIVWGCVRSASQHAIPHCHSAVTYLICIDDRQFSLMLVSETMMASSHCLSGSVTVMHRVTLCHKALRIATRFRFVVCYVLQVRWPDVSWTEFVLALKASATAAAAPDATESGR